MKNIKPKLKLIDAAFDKLRRVFDSSCRNYVLELFEECKREEKEHRDFSPNFGKYHPHAASLADTARSFAVQRVATYLLKPETMPKGQAFLHYQRSCFIAAGMAEEFRDRILAAWEGLPIGEIAAIDYIELVSPEIHAVDSHGGHWAGRGSEGISIKLRPVKG